MHSYRPLVVRIAVAMFAIATCGACRTARAQQAPPNDLQPPKEFVALMLDIGDIDELGALNPLKLTADQLDKLISTVKAAQDAYNKQLIDITVPPIKSIADDIRETRRKMLETGSEVPKDFNAKVNKIVDDYNKHRDDVEADTLKNLADKIHAILTKSQIDTAVGIARKITAKDSGQPAPKGNDDKYFNYYVLGTFVVYPRTLAVLQDMRKQAASAATHGAATRFASRPGAGQ